MFLDVLVSLFFMNHQHLQRGLLGPPMLLCAHNDFQKFRLAVYYVNLIKLMVCPRPQVRRISSLLRLVSRVKIQHMQRGLRGPSTWLGFCEGFQIFLLGEYCVSLYEQIVHP